MSHIHAQHSGQLPWAQLFQRVVFAQIRPGNNRKKSRNNLKVSSEKLNCEEQDHHGKQRCDDEEPYTGPVIPTIHLTALPVERWGERKLDCTGGLFKLF